MYCIRENVKPNIIRSAENCHTLGTNASFYNDDASEYLNAENFAIWVKIVSKEPAIASNHAYHVNSNMKLNLYPLLAIKIAEIMAKLKFW